MRGFSRSLYVMFIASTLAGTAPAMVAECKPLARVMSLDIKVLPSGRPSIPVMIGDTPEYFLVDTGGAFSTVTRATVKKYDLTPGRARRTLTGVSGAKSNEEVRLPSITIGNIRQPSPLLMVDPNAQDPNQRFEYAGILGPDFLGGFDLDFDFAAGKLNLMSPDHCAGQVVYWQAPAVAVVPMQMDASAHIRIPVMLDGKKLDGMIDTGAFTSTLSLIDAERTFNIDINAPDVEKVGELTGGYSANVYRHQFKTLAIEGVTVTNPVLVLLPDLVTGGFRQAPRTGSLIVGDKRGASMLLGMTLLRRLHVYVAYKERKLYITAANS